MATASNLGFPRIGAKRELKKATESFWKGDLSSEELLSVASGLRQENWKKQQDAGVSFIPSNDFSFYDQVLDMSCLVGNVPERYGWSGGTVDLETYFLMARGGGDKTACEMTKWFDTNYHYIVPEFNENTTFSLSSTKVFDEFQEALDQGIKTRPVLIGPVTYLTLGKAHGASDANFDRFSLLDSLLPVYVEALNKLKEQGAEWVQLDEPACALDLTDQQRALLDKAYATLREQVTGLKFFVTNYFGDLRDNLGTFFSLPADAYHVDAVRGASELGSVLNAVPEGKILSVGVVDGRNIWKNDYTASLSLLAQARDAIGSERLWVSPSCSLIHSPVTLQSETKLDQELLDWLAFAEEKLQEIVDLTQILDGQAQETVLKVNEASAESRKNSTRIHNQTVKERAAAVTEADAHRASVFAERQKVQRDKLGLPMFPTTTIGSFPQTKEVRALRAQFKKSEISETDYDTAMEAEIKKCVEFQNEIGLDVPVHGEFERNDMVEYFGELLDGFVFTSFGWVQSYGSRYVKPPIIFGDVSRPEPMTVRWSSFAQSLTDKPMKGMLTGPVTILQWSFVRNDQPRSETTKQIALAIRDEVQDLEKANIRVIQVDEPAFREGLPLREADWAAYLKWAAEGFRLATSGVEDTTQIHTHMCYAEFNDIIEAIADLDADVISVETSRSQMELLKAFVEFQYPNEIGPGVYDIHSPRVPDQSEMEALLQKAEEVLPAQNIWVNPDCGLKTRGWEEVSGALKNLVAAAKTMREAQSVSSN